MADVFPTVWASDESADVQVPTAAQIAIGFRCGKANPGWFNWLFQQLMGTINELNLGDFVNKVRRVDATEGVTGGGALTEDLTLRLNFQGLEEKVIAADADLLAVFDPLSGAHRSMRRDTFLSGVGGGGGGGVTGGTNIGTGPGEVYAGVSGANLQFRNLLGANGVVVAVAGNNVTIGFANMGDELTY